ncbi:MAG: TMF family protein [Magnetococcales bacterium]|nr:TMF family protein [Magnetococcales bacterium]
MPTIKQINNKVAILSLLAGCLAFGTAANSAIADETPSNAEMWNIVQKQQKEMMDTLKTMQNNNQMAAKQANGEVEGVSLKIDKNAGVLPEGISISGVGTVHISANEDLPTRAQMWEAIQKQQQEIEALKGVQTESQNKVDSLKMQQSENANALNKTKKDLDQVNQKLESSKSLLPEGASIGGTVEVELSQGKDFSDTESNDLTLATLELTFETKINNWLSTNFALLYEDPDPINVDTATVTIANSDRTPFYVTAGLAGAPFGSFETQLLSDPLTLSLGESGGEVLVIAGVEKQGFSGSAYIFNGDTSETGQNDTIDQGGLSVSYSVESENVSFSLGAGYINSIADSDGITEALASPNGLRDKIGGYTFNGIVAVKGLTIIGEYLGSAGTFQNSELAWNGKGAKPSAWMLEVGYTFEVANREATVAANIQGSSQAVALGLPKSRFALGGSIAMLENTTVGFEWTHDKDYSTSDTGAGNTAGSPATDKTADAATMKLSVEF